MKKPVYMILAAAQNGTIGNLGRLPWRIPEDWQYFLKMTRGGILVHGRKCQVHHGKPLPDREIIVLTRNHNYKPPGPNIKLASSLHAALSLAQALPHPGPIWIGGGAEIYRASIPLVERVYLTEIHADFPGDVFMPWDIFARNGFTKVLEQHPGAPGPVPYVFKVLARP